MVEIPQRYSHPGHPNGVGASPGWSRSGRRLGRAAPARADRRLPAQGHTLSLLGAPAWAAGLATLAATEDLLESADRLARKLTPPACRQAGVALAVLHSDGYDALQELLRHPFPSGGSAKQWNELRSKAAQTMGHVHARHGDAGLAFMLGWVRRLGRILDQQSPSNPRHRR